MSGIKRYGMDRRGGSLTAPESVLWGMIEKEEGPYVLFSDHEAEVAGLRTLVARMAEALRGLHQEIGSLFHGPEDEVVASARRRSMLPVPDDRPSTLKSGAGYGWVIAMGEIEARTAALLADPSVRAAEEWLKAQKREAVREALERVRLAIVARAAEIKDESNGLVLKRVMSSEGCLGIIDKALATLAPEATKGEEKEATMPEICGHADPETGLLCLQAPHHPAEDDGSILHGHHRDGWLVKTWREIPAEAAKPEPVTCPDCGADARSPKCFMDRAPGDCPRRLPLDDHPEPHRAPRITCSCVECEAARVGSPDSEPPAEIRKGE